MLAFLILICAFTTSTLAADLPPNFPRCHRDDPNINDCMLKATETVRPYLKQGLPSLDIPSLDPLLIPSISMSQGTDAVNFNITLTNVILRGLGDYVFEVYDFDLKKLKFHGVALFPSLSMNATYEANGKVLFAPFTGKGNYSTLLGPSRGIVDTEAELVTIAGEEYLNPTKVKASIQLSNYTDTIDGLFGGNEELQRAFRELVKENQEELLKEFLPVIETVAQELTFKIYKGVSNKIPFKKLYPISK